MDQNLMKRQRELTDRLNRYRNEYYNLNSPSVSDAVYDRLFEELQALEKQTGIQMANSPTSTVGYPAVSKLEKTSHPIPLLSLDKVKNTEELCRFMGEHQVMFMLKLDGLTVKLTYEGGRLVEAATRGDGDVGEIVTHNTCAISGIPARIQYEDRLVVTGEAFIRPSDFEQLRTVTGNPTKTGAIWRPVRCACLTPGPVWDGACSSCRSMCWRVWRKCPANRSASRRCGRWAFYPASTWSPSVR